MLKKCLCHIMMSCLSELFGLNWRRILNSCNTSPRFSQRTKALLENISSIFWTLFIQSTYRRSWLMQPRNEWRQKLMEIKLKLFIFRSFGPSNSRICLIFHVSTNWQVSIYKIFYCCRKIGQDLVAPQVRFQEVHRQQEEKSCPSSRKIRWIPGV